MTEAELTREIIKALNMIPGVWCWRMNTGRRGGVSFGLKGQSDITGVLLGGTRLELEVKKPKNNRFEPEQPAFIQRMKAHGALVGVVHSVDEAIAIVTARILPESRVNTGGET